MCGYAMSIPSVMKSDTSYSIHPTLDLERVVTDYGHFTLRMRWKFQIEQNSTSTDESYQDQNTTTGTNAFPKSKRGYWYLASPYTKHPAGTDQAVREAAEAQAALANVGIIAYSPILMGHQIAGAISGTGDHDYWMEYNDPLLRGACGLLILMNSGWDTSRGVRDEYKLFVNDEKPCLFLSYPLTAYNLQTLKITISQFATDAG